MRDALHVPELDLGRGAVGVHVEREGELEELLPLVPVDVGDHLQLGFARRERQVCVTRDAPNARSTTSASPSIRTAVTSVRSVRLRR